LIDVGSERRARQKANRAKKLEEVQKVEQRDQRRQYAIIGVLIAAGIGGAIFLLSLGGDDDVEATDASTTSVSIEASTTTAPELIESAVSAPEPGGTIDGTAECPAADGSSERITTFSEEPPLCIDETATYTAEINTTAGVMTVELDAAAAPGTVNNFVFLSRYHYYDGSPFHRIIPGFVIQGGDATGNPLGTGNPGYTIEEEPPAAGEYVVGSLAMAKSQGPKATGAQFFVITGPQGEALPPEYSLFGEVSDGLDVALAIEQIPTNALDQPTDEIYIESITITEG
jgi:cyclophilin family peptidyl-prolyl cis-trans isomerase